MCHRSISDRYDLAIAACESICGKGERVDISDRPDLVASAPGERGSDDVAPNLGEEISASAADAASAAVGDAEAAAKAAANTEAAAFGAVQAAARLATRARTATAATAAAVAAATAEVAVRAAAGVQAEAVKRAGETAASAVEALEIVAAELPPGSDHAAAVRKAAAVAATVAADVGAYANATAAAAAKVSAAVRTAVETAASAAEDAATVVEEEAAVAAMIREAVANSTETTTAATGLVVESTNRAADLTARLAVVAALRDSEHRFRVTFDHAPVGMMLISLSGEDAGRVLRANPALSDLTGRTEAELLALNEHDLVHVDELAARTARFSSLLSGEASDYEAVARWRHADGRDVWVRLNLHAIREGDARPMYAVGQVEDITERLRTEAALRVREERFRLAFDNAHTGMLSLSVDGVLLKANEGMFRLLGYGEHKLLGQDVQSLACPGEQASIHTGIQLGDWRCQHLPGGALFLPRRRPRRLGTGQRVGSARRGRPAGPRGAPDRGRHRAQARRDAVGSPGVAR